MGIKISKKALEIVRWIHKLDGAATANEIKKKSKISYVTVQKYLKALEKLKIVKSSEHKSRKYYSVNYDYLRSDKL